MSDLQYVTKETLEQMKIDLQRMKAVDRPAASRAIAEARAAYRIPQVPERGRCR